MTVITLRTPDRLAEVLLLPARDSLAPYLPTLGAMDFDAGSGAHHVDLPSDIVTVALHCGEDSAAALMVMVSPVRAQARRFQVVGRSQVAVATLTPLGLLSAFGVPVTQVADRLMPVDELCGRGEAHRLAAMLHRSATLADRAVAFACWLESLVLARRRLPAPGLRVAQAALELSDTSVPAAGQVVRVAARLSVTRRQLERDFRAQLGVSPATFGRLVRFQRAAAAVASGRPLLSVALDQGFADQAHMNRVFREFADVTPREMARDGTRPGRDLVRQGLGGRVFLLDVAPHPQPRLAA